MGAGALKTATKKCTLHYRRITSQLAGELTQRLLPNQRYDERDPTEACGLGRRLRPGQDIWDNNLNEPIRLANNAKLAPRWCCVLNN